MTRLTPFYDQVQAHYDLSNEFFELFLDPSMTYSCAYFERQGMTLAEAQSAKIDLSLRKCDLKPGMRLLDVGCGWGATLRRAAEKYGVHAIGLTLSRNQFQYIEESLAENPPSAGSIDVRLQGWEEFDEPVDRIISIGAFEHFRKERYAAFFDGCRRWLPRDGKMMLHTILGYTWRTLEERGLPLEHEHVLFVKFLLKHIFPGGDLCEEQVVREHAERAGFRVEHTQSLRQHYAQTLDRWAANLRVRRPEAVVLTSEATYDIYMHYLTGCARYFRSGHVDVMQFTLSVA